jgi:hypothetical protein
LREKYGTLRFDDDGVGTEEGKLNLSTGKNGRNETFPDLQQNAHAVGENIAVP